MKNSKHRHGLRMVAFLVALHASFFASQAQTKLSPYHPGQTPEGAVYYLPKTALRISVLVEKTTYQPGDFAPYAQRYLRVADVSQEPKQSYRVTDVLVTPCPVPDSSKVYAVRFNPLTVASRMMLSGDGRLLGLNVDDVTDVDMPPFFVPTPQPTMKEPRSLLNEEILSCGSTAKMAELTASEIYDLRENRSLLIKGQADFMPHDGRQMQIMLDELDANDRSLTSLFVGVTRRDTTEHILWYVPEAAPDSMPAPSTRQVLFRLSQLRGLVEPDDLSGAPYYIMVDDISQLPPAEPTAKKAKAKTESGIYVNVPGRMRATILEGINPILVQDMPASQFGRTLLLSGSLFNKRYTTRLRLNALTGALERLDADQPKKTFMLFSKKEKAMDDSPQRAHE